MAMMLSKVPLLDKMAGSLGLLSQNQMEFIKFAKNTNIVWADAANHITHKDNSVEVLYIRAHAVTS
jgi:hypothetical protein